MSLIREHVPIEGAGGDSLLDYNGESTSHRPQAGTVVWMLNDLFDHFTMKDVMPAGVLQEARDLGRLMREHFDYQSPLSAPVV